MAIDQPTRAAALAVGAGAPPKEVVVEEVIDPGGDGNDEFADRIADDAGVVVVGDSWGRKAKSPAAAVGAGLPISGR